MGNLKSTLEWAMIAVVMLSYFIWVGYNNPAQAQSGYYDEYGYYHETTEPEFYSGVENPPDMTIYRYGHGSRSGRRYQEPEHFSDIKEKPQIIINRGGWYSTH